MKGVIVKVFEKAREMSRGTFLGGLSVEIKTKMEWEKTNVYIGVMDKQLVVRFVGAYNFPVCLLSQCCDWFCSQRDSA